MAHDGHTRLQYEQGLGCDYLLFNAWRFEDDWFVTHAVNDHAVEAKLVAINGYEMDEVIQRVRPYISYENEMGFLSHVPNAIRNAQLLAHVGIAESTEDEIYLDLLDSAGQSMRLAFEPTDRGGLIEWIASLPDDIHRPLYLRRTHEAYWYTRLEDVNIVYAQINALRNNAHRSFSLFEHDLVAHLRLHSSDGLIIDLRHAAGGYASMVSPFAQAITQIPFLRGLGRVYVIVGRSTFSAGLQLALRLGQAPNVVIVGESPGGSPGRKGKAIRFLLPHSGLSGSVSDSLVYPVDPSSMEAYMKPDIFIDVTHEDFLQNRDPVVENVKNQIRM